MSAIESPQKLNSLPAVATPEGKPILRGRLKSPSDLVNQFETLYMADLESSINRTLAQEQRDGVPPFSQSRERAAGLAGRANINWGFLDTMASDAEAPYIDILEGISNFCTMPTSHGNESQRLYWEYVMEEEFSLVLRSWPRFYPLWQQNAMIFVGEGLSFAFFDDDIDWRWSIKGQQDIKFPRRTDADINILNMICSRVEITPEKLFSYCQNKEIAIQEGWNPTSVWDAIVRCGGQQGIRGNDFQEWQMAWKNNDLILGTSNFTIPCIHGWLPELDGSVTHAIAASDSGDQGVDKFLYYREGKYRRLSNMIIPYCYGVGANGTFHGIRGLYSKSYNACSGLNRAMNRALDLSIHASTPWIQSDSEDTITELPLMPLGPYGVLKAGNTFAELKVPPFEQTMMPIITMLQEVFRMRGGSFTGGIQNDRTERTKYEKEMQDQKEGKIATGGVNLFKLGWSMHLKEVIRRFKNPDYSSRDPGGEEVIDFRQRCKDRGVPMEAIDKIDVKRVEVNLGLGKGSAAERRGVVDTLNQTVFYRLDPYGQNRLNNMTISAYAGSRIANELAPLKQGLRPPNDLWDAKMENQVMTLGGEADLELNQDHMVHAGAHIEELGKINDALIQQQIQLQQAIPIMQKIQAHTQDHMQYVDQEDPKAITFRETLTALNEVIDNGAKQIFAEEAKAKREMEHNGQIGAGGNGQQPDGQQPNAGQEGTEPGLDANSSTLVQAAQVQQKMRDLNLITNQKLQHRELEFRQKMAIRDAEAAAKIGR